jgi:hypothetical protein
MRTAIYALISAIVFGVMSYPRPVAAQDVALNFKQGFIDSYTRAAVKKEPILDRPGQRRPACMRPTYEPLDDIQLPCPRAILYLMRRRLLNA